MEKEFYFIWILSFFLAVSVGLNIVYLTANASTAIAEPHPGYCSVEIWDAEMDGFIIRVYNETYPEEGIFNTRCDSLAYFCGNIRDFDVPCIWEQEQQVCACYVSFLQVTTYAN